MRKSEIRIGQRYVTKYGEGVKILRYGAREYRPEVVGGSKHDAMGWIVERDRSAAAESFVLSRNIERTEEEDRKRRAAEKEAADSYAKAQAARTLHNQRASEPVVQVFELLKRQGLTPSYTQHNAYTVAKLVLGPVDAEALLELLGLAPTPMPAEPSREEGIYADYDEVVGF
jgi:hypothetical protein